MSSSRISFHFRVWLYPEEEDRAIVECWCPGLETTEDGVRFKTEFVHEYLTNSISLHRVFGLRGTDKCWQVAGTGELRGCYDPHGDYDAEIHVLTFEKAEVPRAWLEENFLD